MSPRPSPEEGQEGFSPAQKRPPEPWAGCETLSGQASARQPQEVSKHCPAAREKDRAAWEGESCPSQRKRDSCTTSQHFLSLCLFRLNSPSSPSCPLLWTLPVTFPSAELLLWEDPNPDFFPSKEETFQSPAFAMTAQLLRPVTVTGIAAAAESKDPRMQFPTAP